MLRRGVRTVVKLTSSVDGQSSAVFWRSVLKWLFTLEKLRKNLEFGTNALLCSTCFSQVTAPFWTIKYLWQS